MKNVFAKLKGKSQGQQGTAIRLNGQLGTRMWKSRDYYLMLLPAVVYVILFCYAPMYGLQIAFKNYKVSLGVADSPWIGLRNFTDFFQSYYFVTLLKNTLVLSMYSLVIGFPIPIVIALILNEMIGKFKNFTQTILY